MSSVCTVSEEFVFKNIISQTNSLTLEQTRNETFISDLVRKIGLVRDFRPLYGFGNKPGSEETFMHKRRNYGMFQLPKQVGCMLQEISQSSTSVSSFIEIGSFYGWTGLFFSVFLRRIHTLMYPSNFYSSASFDVLDMRTPCIKFLMNKYKHDFYVNEFGRHLKKQKNRPILSEDYSSASKWYYTHLNKTFGKKVKKIDLCFIDGEHGYKHVSADVKFFSQICKFLLFHDIVDTDSYGVRYTWNQLKTQRKESYFKECTQQAGTNRKNFGLGIISANDINAFLLK